MKKTLFLAVFALLAITANAQVSFGVKGGMNVTNMSLNKDLFSASNRTGFYLGPTLKATIEAIGLGVDVSVLYDQRETQITYETTTAEPIKQRQLAIPLNAHLQLHMGDIGSFLIFAGPQFGLNITSDKDKTLISDRLNWEWKTTNISVNVGAGFIFWNHFMISANYNVACGKTGEFKLSDICQDWKDADTDARLHSWQLGATYYF